MRVKRITISVPAEVASKAARAVEAGMADSVSAYFAQLAENEPDWVEAASTLDAMIDEAGGLGEADIEWARSVLGLSRGTDAA